VVGRSAPVVDAALAVRIEAVLDRRGDVLPVGRV
jgi:hypothetical protein